MATSISTVRQEKNASDYIIDSGAKIKKGLHFIVNETDDAGTVNKATKLARRLFEFLNAIPSLEIFGTAANFFKTFGNVFNILSVFKNAQDILLLESVEKVALGILGFNLATLSAIKMMELFSWIDLAKISLNIGSQALPFGQLITGVEIVKSSLEIGFGAKRIIELSKKIIQTKRKMKFWKEGLTQTKCEQRAQRYHIEGKRLKSALPRFKKEKELFQAKTDKWTPLYEAQARKAQVLLNSQKKTERLFAKTSRVLRKIVPTQVTKKTRKWTSLNDQMAKVISDTQAAIVENTQKETGWNKMSKLFQLDILPSKVARYTADKAKINDFCTNKLSKWNFKKVNIAWDLVKESLSVTIAVSGISIMIVGAGVLAGGTSGIAAPLSLASVGLAVALFGLGTHFFKKCKKPKPIFPVKLPTLSQAAAAA